MNSSDKFKEGESRTRGIVTFLVFLAISALFWLFMSLNDEYQRNYLVAVEIVGVPDDVTLLNEPPKTINVTVRDHGRALLPYELGETPTLRLRYSDFVQIDDNRLLVNRKVLSDKVNDIFSTSTTITTLQPDSIGLRFTKLPGVKVPVIARIDANAVPEAEIFGQIKLTPDTALIYSLDGKPLRRSPKFIETEHIELHDLSDSISVKVRLMAPSGTIVRPNEVTAVVPVQKLIAKTAIIPVKPFNIPDGYSVSLMPAEVEVTYLLPLSILDEEPDMIEVIADFENSLPENNEIELTISHVPDYMRSVDLLVKSADFNAFKK